MPQMPFTLYRFLLQMLIEVRWVLVLRVISTQASEAEQKAIVMPYPGFK